jgi:hypothetical protein
MSRGTPAMASSTARHSPRLSTAGRLAVALARGSGARPERGLPRTSRYKKRSAHKAWVRVEAERRSSTASRVRQNAGGTHVFRGMSVEGQEARSPSGEASPWLRCQRVRPRGGRQQARVASATLRQATAANGRAISARPRRARRHGGRAMAGVNAHLRAHSSILLVAPGTRRRAPWAAEGRPRAAEQAWRSRRAGSARPAPQFSTWV